MKMANGSGSIIKLGGKRRKPRAVRVTVGWVDGKQKHSETNKSLGNIRVPRLILFPLFLDMKF